MEGSRNPGVVLGLHLCAFITMAQTTSTGILGTVTDPTGAVVPDARVTLVRVATGEKRTATTTSSGDYSFPLIEIGEYSVAVEVPGFKPQEKRGILVQLQQRARVDFQLAVGETRETVEVIATGIQQLKTEDATVGQVIDNKRTVELPLNGRNVATLAVLLPGVQFGLRQGLDGQGGVIPGRTVAVSANGQREVSQQITLDGITAATARQNVMNFTPSIDAIEEFKVQTSSYSAEYGHANGALVQIAFKSGTNQLHGTFYEFLRNDKLAAADYFLNFQLPPGTRRQEKNRLRRNQFGSFLSGPVLLPRIYSGRNWTFWSFNYEGQREIRETVREGFWFPEAFRNGDFSALLTPLVRNGRPLRAPIIIYDPLTGEPFRDSSGRITNMIPPSRINRNAQSFINRFQPLPMFHTEDILDTNAIRSVADRITSNQVFFRIDHNFSSSDKVFLRYLTDRARRNDDDLNPNFPRTHIMEPTNVAFQWIHIFSPRVLNEFRFGSNYQLEANRNPRTDTDFDLDSLGIGQFRVAVDGNRKLTPSETGIPTTIIGGDRNSSFSIRTTSNTYQYTDNLVIIHGAHSFKTGFDFRRPSSRGGSSNDPRGRITGGEGGYALAGWLLGFPSNTLTPEGEPFSQGYQNRWSAYFLDEWKVTRRLTLNAGLRWDFFQVPLDRADSRNLRLDILSTASDGRQLPTLVPAPGTPHYPPFDSYNRYFMPRIGLAYRASDKWVVRSGFGWFVHPGHIGSPGLLVRNPPKGGTFGFNQVTDVAQTIRYEYAGQAYNVPTRKFRAGAPVLTFDNAFPGTINPASQRANLIMFPPDNRYTNTVQWSLDIQRALPWSTLLTIGYIGSKTSHMDNSVQNFNSPDPSPDTDINRRRPYQAYVSQGEGNQARPLGTLRYMDSYSNSSYHGLQTTVERRYSGGLTFGLSYAYSKALGEGYERNNNFPFQNPRDRRSSRQRFPFDVTHSTTIHYVYEPPFLTRFKGLAGAFLGGWQTNGIITLRTGFPFSVTGGNLNTGSTTRPDRVADGRLGSRATRQLWYEPSAFRRTDCNLPGRLDLCHYGNAGPSILVSPGARAFDLSIYKNWRLPWIGEAGRLQFRAESFNTFNTPQFGQPNDIGFVTPTSIVPDAPRMGEVRTLRLPMRIVQFGMKLYF
jgi:hypothetical protein